MIKVCPRCPVPYMPVEPVEPVEPVIGRVSPLIPLCLFGVALMIAALVARIDWSTIAIVVAVNVAVIVGARIAGARIVDRDRP